MGWFPGGEKKDREVKSIGIVANPASGKDIRRLVSYATVIDNNEKVNITKRIVLAASALGIERVYFMPDTFRIGGTVKDELTRERALSCEVEVVDMPLTASAADSQQAARSMEALGVGCIVVLGGDGTCRAVAKGITDVPIVPISTGTNNVYPTLIEGTVAGLAAAAEALIGGHRCCIRDKRIELYLNGELADIALIDAVLSDQIFVGSKAIWDMSSVRRVVVTRCHPASIGFSAIAGCVEIVRDTDDCGFTLATSPKAGGSPGSGRGSSPGSDRGSGEGGGEGGSEGSDEGGPGGGPGSGRGRLVRAPIAAGVLEDVYVEDERFLPLGSDYTMTADGPGTVALDGERELKVKAHDVLRFRVCQNGPWRVDTRRILEEAKSLGYFERS